MASTATAADTAKSIPLPTFDGEPKKFQMWWMHFKSYAAVKKFSQAIQRTADPNMPPTESTNVSQNAAQSIALERNLLAIASLSLAFQSEGQMNMIQKAESKDWPSGKAHIVVDNLFRKYRPVDTISRVEMRVRLNQVSMKPNQDPKVLFDQLASIQNAYNDATRDIDPDDLIAVVLEKAPKEYKSILTTEQRNKGTNLTLENLEEAMHDLYRAMNSHCQPTNDNEVALVAFRGTCHYCKKPGHMARDCTVKRAALKKGTGTVKNLRPCKHCGGKHMDNNCWELPQNASKRPAGWKSKKNSGTETGAAAIEDGGPQIELLLSSMDMTFPNSQALLSDPNIWIADSAATVHMTPHGEGMINLRDNKGSGIRVGSGEVIVAKKKGDIPCTLHNKHGIEVGDAKLTNVALIKTTPFNLFSITKAMKDGWTLSGNQDTGLVLTKQSFKLEFDIPIATKEGCVFAMHAKRTAVNIAAAAVTMNIEKAHRLLGHQSEAATKKTANHLTWNITRGTMKPCLPCTIGKAKQKNTIKESDHESASVPGERVFTDIASVKPKEGVNPTKPHWCIKVDEKTQFKVSTFHKNKDDMVEPSCETFHKWKQGGNPVKFIRCDNAGENKTLQKRANSADWKLNISFEFTPRDTPQHNHLAELGFASIAGKGRALMSAANVPMKVRAKVWVKAFGHATDLDGLIVTTIGDKTATRYEHWCGHLPKWVKYLRTWGEAGTVKIKSKTTSKIADRGIQCMFVGHSKDHDGDCFEMWNPKNNYVYTTRDVIWLHRMYYTKPVEEGVETEVMEVETPPVEAPEEVAPIEEDDEPESDPEATNEHEEAPKGLEEQIMAETAQVPRSTLRSGTTFRDVATANIDSASFGLCTAEINYLQALQTLQDNELGCVGAGIGGGFDHTSELHVMKYNEAMATPDADKWKIAVKEEIQRMEDNQVWTPVDKDQVPTDATILTSTWAMKKKSNGKFRARLNGRGYEQVPGEHYDPSSLAAPVVSSITIRIVFVLMLMAMWPGYILDVRGAFLKGTFD